MADLFGDEIEPNTPSNRKLDCWGCNIAAVNPKSGAFQTDCIECQARSLAQSPAFDDSMRLQYLTPVYQSALRFVFGANVTVSEGHAKVKAWAEKIRPLRPVL